MHPWATRTGSGALNIGTVSTAPSPLVAGQNMGSMSLPITPTTWSIAGATAATLNITVITGAPFCHSGSSDATTVVGSCTWTVTWPVRNEACDNSISLSKMAGCSDWAAGALNYFVLTNPMLTDTTPYLANLQISFVAAWQGSLIWVPGTGVPTTIPITRPPGVNFAAL